MTAQLQANPLTQLPHMDVTASDCFLVTLECMYVCMYACMQGAAALA
jgi:hypothetical protein